MPKPQICFKKESPLALMSFFILMRKFLTCFTLLFFSYVHPYGFGPIFPEKIEQLFNHKTDFCQGPKHCLRG